MLNKRLALAALAATALLPLAGHAQSWPNGPIKVIVPFPAGGASDQIGRVIAKRALERFGLAPRT